jgi:predicted nucleic acid-binding Zn ribbon protein
MRPIQNISSDVLAEMIRRQPASNERTAFAWQLAVGPALARVTTVDLYGGVLTVSAADDRWTKEIARARAIVLAKMQHLLGPEAVTGIRTRFRAVESGFRRRAE